MNDLMEKLAQLQRENKETPGIHAMALNALSEEIAALREEAPEEAA
jgi:formate dehydrogenase assembly factor FdhD